jgi:NAD(P)-dependent dehydrogenase (short-subunit alcohol dehydrogenase family)
MFENKQFVISGGASGIGLACARLLSAQGAKLLLLGRNAKKGAAAAASLRDATSCLQT